MNQIVDINIKKIIIKRRVRQDLTYIESLAESFSRHGQLTPIIVNAKHELIAGNRRIEAARLLGWKTIQAYIINKKSEADKLELELEENVQRQPLTEMEINDGYKRLEKLKNPHIFVRIWNWIKAFFRRLFGRD